GKERSSQRRNSVVLCRNRVSNDAIRLLITAMKLRLAATRHGDGYSSAGGGPESPPTPGPQPTTAPPKPAPTAPKTVRDPRMPTGPGDQSGLEQLIERKNGGKAARYKWEGQNIERGQKWSEEFQRRLEAARPEMDEMLQETGSAKSILKGIAEALRKLTK